VRIAFLPLLLTTLSWLAPTLRAQDPADPLGQEPVVGVFLASGPSLSIRLAETAVLELGGRTQNLAPGSHTLERTPTGFAFAGRRGGVDREAVIRTGGRPIVRLDAQPVFGAPRTLLLAGDLRLRVSGETVEVIEELPMERYIASVVIGEMSARWPAPALAAQAIVARSYAAARWLERRDQPWQLHWHFGVDMAYAGWTQDLGKVAKAIAPTRGEMLVFRGLPVLALFHASSGGRTEAFERVKPGVLGPDGKTSIAAAMPVVEDGAALAGAAGLNLEASHGHWKLDLPLPEVTEALAAWSAAQAGRPAFGTVEGVSVEERHDDSGRVATVAVRHRLDGQTRFTHLAGTDFRLALGPVRVRSLLWDRCVVASKAPGYLVIEGRGFGHGCGLSQVSAWQLAKAGESPEAIVARFYAGARIEKHY
jgi:peptidoglycan hydrolase-like amidase